MTDTTEVAIIGAGPYGLSLAAHLRSAGVPHRHFGFPMSLWRTSMPRGMYLKSQGFASNLSDPDGTHTLRNFCRETGRAYADYGLPVALRTFLDYGEWFQLHRCPDVEEVQVTELTERAGRFELGLLDGERVRARHAVVAAGVEHFAHLPQPLADLPRQLCSHSSAHDDLGVFAGKEVVVLGAGQSALEAAALLHEGGAKVTLVARRGELSWNGRPLLPDRSLWRRVREPEAGLGSGLSTWFYSERPSWFRRLPTSMRVERARTALGPAGAWWLRDRVEGEFPVHVGHELEWAEAERDRVRLGLRVRSSGESREITADHVVSATGFPPDLSRLRFLDPQLTDRLRQLAATPRVDRDFESSVPGLFFAGAIVAPTFGPVMRFVYGADHAVRQISGRLRQSGARRLNVVGGVGSR